MLRLDTTTTKLQALLAGAVATNNLPVYAAYSDQGASTYTGAKKASLLAGATAVDICDAPAADTVRDIDYVSIANADTVAVTVTVRINDNGTLTTLYVCTLEIGERLEYVHGAGFRAMTAAGATKSGSVQDLSGYQQITGKDGSGGYVGLTGYAINFKNLLGAIVSLFQNANTAIRTYSFPDRSMTVAGTDDIITAHSGLSGVGTNTHGQIDTALTRLANTSGTNTGDQDLSSYATTAAVAAGYQSLDSDLTALAGLNIAADKLPYGTGSHTLGLTDLTAAGRALLDDADAAAQRTTLTLGNVDNTSDANKPVSTAQQAALDLKANLASPALTGTPTAPTAAASTSTTQVATTAFVAGEVAAAVAGLLDFKGSTDASASPNYPAASKGDSYVVSVAGKVGGASGKSVDVGDLYVASADNAGGTEASVGTSWFVLEHNLAGALLATNNLSDLANAGTARTNLGLSANGSSLVTAANYAAMRVLLGLVVGTDVQAYDAELNALAGLASAADKLPYFTGSGTAALADLSAAGRALIDDADAAAQRTTLGAQATLVSGTNIKTINSTSLLGSGDIAIAASPGGSDTHVQYNSSSAFAGSANFTWDQTNKKLSVKGTGTAGTSTLRVNPASGASFIQMNDNGTMVIDADVSSGVYPTTWKSAGTTVATMYYTGLLTVNSLNLAVGYGLLLKTGGNNLQLQAFNVLELAVGVGGTGSKAQVNNGTLNTLRDMEARAFLHGSYTVATLPSVAGVGGGHFYVTDLTSLTNGSTATGGGSSKGFVKSDGSAYIVLG